MRLGQLARQLEIKPAKIVSFLEKEKNITIKSHPNCKVEDDFIEMITNHFKPVTEEVVSTKEEAKVKPEAEPVEDKKTTEEAPAPIEHLETKKPAEPQELKIIGKIDLPNKKEIQVEVDGVVYDQETLDAKKKEDLKVERERKALEKEEKRKADEEKKRIAREKREVEAERQAMLKTEKHNLLSKEEEKKKALILKVQKEREAKLEAKRKKRQKEHYAQQVVAKTSVKKKKKVEAKNTTQEPAAKTLSNVNTEEVRETSIYKRFIKWLNT